MEPKALSGLVRSNSAPTGRKEKKKEKEKEKEKDKAKEKEKKKAKEQQTREEALKKLAELGSAAFRLSRAHLLALARDLGVREKGGSSPTKKELFRLLTGELPAGAGRGLRPGKPGKELNAL